MIYNEDFVVLEEDEDIETVVDEVLLEGEIVLDEDIKTSATRRYKVINSPSDIDYEESKENIDKLVSKFNSLKNKPGKNYRDYKASDKQLLVNKLRNKEFWKNVLGMGTVTYSAVKYKVFQYKGLTLVSFHVPTEIGKEVGTGVRVANPCYAVLIKNDATVVLKKIKIYGKKIDVEDRVS